MITPNSILFRVGLCVAVMLLAAASVSAQTVTGTFAGTVTDSSGAVIPGAKITLTHKELNVATEVYANEEGNYVASALRAGPYDIEVSSKGFETTRRKAVVLHVNERVVLDFVMKPGEVTTVVEVTGGGTLLQTQSADVGQVIESRTMVDLPLDGRRYVDLMLLSPGALPAPGVRSNPREGRINVDGNFSLQNYFVMNGVDNNSFTQNAQDRSPQVVRPSPDALREFRVQTRTYTAEFGWAQGAVINAEIKSGSNDWHGSGWWFHRNDGLNAANFFANQAGLSKPEEKRNQQGFTIGGPVLRNRTFFFVDYEYSKANKGTTNSGTVPTVSMRNGVFTGLRNLRDPSVPDPAVPGFPGIPLLAGCVNAVTDVINLTALRTDGRPCGDPVGMALVKLYPDPNSGTFGFTSALDVPLDQHSFDVRLDHRFGNSDNIYGVYSYFDVDTVVERGPFPNLLATGGFSANSKVRGQLVSATWVHTFSPRLVNDARAGFNRVHSISEPLAPAGDAGPDFGLNNLPGTFAFGLPPIRPSGYTFLGTADWRPQFTVSQVYQFLDNLSYVRGNHELKFGFEYKRAVNNFLDIQAPNGRINIPNFWTGDGIANLLLGLLSGVQATTPFVPHNYMDGWMLYGQDSWRITPSFTINYGIRYEYFTPLIERDRKVSNFDPTANGGRGALITANPNPFTSPACLATFPCILQSSSGGTFGRTLIHPDRNNIAPRLGFAWNMMNNIVLRGGFGIFYQSGDRIGSSAVLQLNPPQLIDSIVGNVNSSQVPVLFLRNGFPAVPSVFNPLTINLRGRDMNERTPYSEQWSFGPQMRFLNDYSLEIAYVGQASHKIRKLRRLNQGRIVSSAAGVPAADCISPGVAPCVVFPFPDFGRGLLGDFLVSDGNTNYHSLQINLRKQFSRGVTFNAAYTWGKALGNVGDNLSGGSSSSQINPQNSHNLAADYGRLNFDQTHRFVTNWLWELPFGPGKRYLSDGMLAKLLGDWQFNGIYSSTSGVPITISIANDRSRTFSPNPRADCIGQQQTGNPTIAQFFNPAGFADPAAFTFGSCGVGTLSSWAHHNWDLSIQKKFQIKESMRIEFRTELFNAFNTPQFDNPNTNRQSPQFGLTNAVQDPERDARVIQIGLKFYF